MAPDPVSEPDPVRYAAAVEEIERILTSIDRDEIDLDELGTKVERAVELLKVCRTKLKATEARVVQVLEDLAADEAAIEAPVADESGDELKLDSGLGTGAPATPDPSKRRGRRRKPDAPEGPPLKTSSDPLDDEELPF